MSLSEPTKISLDFNNGGIEIINAKQYDTESRYINVTCTDYGKKVMLNPATTSAFVRGKKTDGTDILNDAYILNDGTIQVELTPQMLSVVGRHTFDILIVASFGLTVDGLGEIDNFDDLGASVISTLNFFVNVTATPIDDDKVSSCDEFNALIRGMARLVATENHMEALNNEITTAEEERKSNEKSRQIAEEKRETDSKNTLEECVTKVDAAIEECQSETEYAINDCDNALQKSLEAYELCKNSISSANVATMNANSAAQACNDATNNTVQAISNCQNATNAANEAAELCQSVVEQSGVVLKADIVNNLDATEEGKVLDATQGAYLLELIDALPKFYYGTDAPDDSIGKDGDIYFQIIEDESVVTNEETGTEGE